MLVNMQTSPLQPQPCQTTGSSWSTRADLLTAHLALLLARVGPLQQHLHRLDA
jgi:hypothetical protein